MALTKFQRRLVFLLRCRSAGLLASAFPSRGLSSSSSYSSYWPSSISRDNSVKNCGNAFSLCYPEESAERKQFGPLNFGRDYYYFGYAPDWRQLPLENRKRCKRDYFLKATADHAALHYLDNESLGVAVISLNRSEARNAIGAEMLKQLHSTVQGLHHARSAQVLIVCSTVSGVFCAGADLKERRKMGFSETEKFVSTLRSTFSSLEDLQIPTIAVIEGAALGGGLELALACDLRICGEEAVFGLPETSLAIIPGAGGTQRLPRVIGRSRAKELIFTADRIDAQRAEALGLVDHCVPVGKAYDKALSIAQKILAKVG